MMFEFWNTVNDFVCCAWAVVRGMTKSLMPQQTFCLCSDGIDIGGVLHHCINRKG